MRKSYPNFKFALNLHRALYRIDHTGKLGEHTIAGGTDNSAAMLLDEGVGHFSVGSQGAQRAHLVLAHQAAVALDISAEDSGEFALTLRGSMRVLDRCGADSRGSGKGVSMSKPLLESVVGWASPPFLLYDPSTAGKWSLSNGYKF